MLRNLLENAVRHGGGTPVEAALHARGSRITITVADRGPGIPEAYRDRIFAKRTAIASLMLRIAHITNAYMQIQSSYLASSLQFVPL